MLLYRSVVLSALSAEVEPALRDMINQALCHSCGEDWYHSYGQSVMADYPDYPRLQEKIEKGVSPLSAMDLTALLFLMYPYRKQGEEIIQLSGAIDKIGEFYHRNSDQVRSFTRIRQIRNNATHDDCDKNLKLSEQDLKNGVQEKKWLDDLERILKPMRPSFRLDLYRMELSQQILRSQNANISKLFADNISNIETIRSETERIYHMDFCQAPIAQPIVGTAPWISCTEDLLRLPSVRYAPKKEENAQSQPAPKPEPPRKAAPAAPSEPKKKPGGLHRLVNWLNR